LYTLPKENMEYLTLPCDCPSGVVCPHYGRLLEGNLWKYTHDLGEIGLRYRRRWLQNVKFEPVKSDCGCVKKKSMNGSVLKN
jgi:hypothetical protein